MIRNPPLVEQLHDSSAAALTALEAQQELSFYADTATLLAKGLLLTCASYYERTITDLVRILVQSGSHPESVKKWLCDTAVDRQFFKWFDFHGAKNTNRFLSRFGSEFKKATRELIDRREWRKQGEASFLLLCTKRNECVHRNFGAYGLELSMEDVHREHLRAMVFVRLIEHAFRSLVPPP